MLAENCNDKVTLMHSNNDELCETCRPPEVHFNTGRRHNSSEKLYLAMEHWKNAEKFWAERLGHGRRQPGSGNQPGKPGDVRYLDRVRLQFDADALLESKATERGALSISKKTLQKIEFEALILGRQPLLGITIGNMRWLAIPEQALTIIGE